MDIKEKKRFPTILIFLFDLMVKSGVSGAFLLMITGIFVFSCGYKTEDPSQTELVRVGTSILTVRQFKQIQDMSQDYYWQDSNGEDAAKDQSKALALLNQITEEMLLEEKAKALEIEVSDKELETAIQNIKADYPEGTFEQVLLENAVSYDLWCERLKVRLLMDKVIEKELESHVNITPEDISSYYNKHYAGIVDRQKSDQDRRDDTDINEIIVKRLRKLKAEELYKKWIKELEQTYPVHVNWTAWKKMLAP